MTNEIADNLLSAECAEVFWREHEGPIDWQTFAALKAEIDRLTVCDLSAAKALAARITELAVHTGTPLSHAFAEASRARILHQEGNDADASALYETAIKTLRRARLSTEAAVLQKQQVAALKYLGRFREALTAARAARRTLAKVSPIQLAQLETNVGNVYYQLDQYNKALLHYDRARAIFATAGDDAMRATVDFGRANILTELDRPDDALALLEKAAAAFEREGQTPYAAQCRFHVAYIQFLKGNYNTALALYYAAREQLNHLGNRQLAAWCDLEIAEILLALNAFDDAMTNAAEARDHFRALNMEYEAAKAAMTLALAAIGSQQFDVAQGALREARHVFAGKKNRTFTALADLYLAELAIHLEDLPEAMRRADAALRVFTRRGLATRSAGARLVAARASLRAGRLAKSARLADAALRDVEGVYAPALAFQSHHLKGQIEQARKRPALGHLRRAVQEIERMRAGVAGDEFKTTFLRDKIDAYEDAIKACLDEGGAEMIDEAFRLVESAKSRSLADMMVSYAREEEAAGGTEDRQGQEASPRARLARLIEELNWYNSHAGLEEDKGDQRRADVADRYRREIARCEKQIAQLFRRVQAESPAVDRDWRQTSFGFPARPTSGLDELRATLAADETAVEYFITGDEISAFIASRADIRLARHVASRREVETALAALRFQLEKFNYGAAYADTHFGQLKRAADGHLTNLYQALLAPLGRHLAGDKLIFIPHGALHYLPFHALRDNGTYLVEDYEISYAPSAAVLRLCREKSGRRQPEGRAKTAPAKPAVDLVALGVVESGTPSIEEEIRALAAIFPDSVQLTGEAATGENLKRYAPEARFLHLASHGYFRRDNPMFSFLKLADANLNFYSLLDFRLRAELVTLSACHTGVNAIFPGDELHGLMRGFLYAGAPSLVMSLWAVHDQSTTVFMREMYEQINAGQSKRAALRRAQLVVKEEYGHPYYWAPFVLLGETGDTER